MVISTSTQMETLNTIATTVSSPLVTPSLGTTTSPEDLKSMLEDRVKEALRKQQALMGGAAKPATAAPVAEPVKPPVKIVLGPNQVLFSKLVGKRLPKELVDFAVTQMDTKLLPPEVAAFVPKNDKGYNLQVEQAHAVLMAWEMNDKVLITGPTGSGKSTLIAQCCALTGRPMIRINMTGDIESSTLFGNLVVESGSTVWKDGPVTDAVKYGAVCCIDEWDVTPPEILFGLQWLFERDGKLFLKEMPGTSEDRMIVPHTNFRMVCLGNTVGQGDDTGKYSGTNVQNNASIDRFGTTIVLDYLNTAHEIKIVDDNCPGLDGGVSAKMVSFAQLVRTAYKQDNINLTMSPRTLVNWGSKIGCYGDIAMALRYSFYNKLRDSDKQVVQELYKKVFGQSI